MVPLTGSHMSNEYVKITATVPWLPINRNLRNPLSGNSGSIIREPWLVSAIYQEQIKQHVIRQGRCKSFPPFTQDTRLLGFKT